MDETSDIINDMIIELLDYHKKAFQIVRDFRNDFENALFISDATGRIILLNGREVTDFDELARLSKLYVWSIGQQKSFLGTPKREIRSKIREIEDLVDAIKPNSLPILSEMARKWLDGK